MGTQGRHRMGRRTAVLSIIGTSIQNGTAEQGKSTTEPGTESTTVRVNSPDCKRTVVFSSSIDSFRALAVSLVL